MNNEIQFDMEAAIQALRQGKDLSGKDGVLPPPLIKQLRYLLYLHRVLLARLKGHSLLLLQVKYYAPSHTFHFHRFFSGLCFLAFFHCFRGGRIYAMMRRNSRYCIHDFPQ